MIQISPPAEAVTCCLRAEMLLKLQPLEACTCPFLFTPMIPAVGSWGAVTKMVSPLILFM